MAWHWCKERAIVGSAQEVADATVESWYVSRHTPARVADAMMGADDMDLDGEDGAFSAAIERGGTGRALLRRLLPQWVLDGPMGELPDVMDRCDRAEAVRQVLVLYDDVDRSGSVPM